MGRGALHRSYGLADAGLRRAAAGGAQRAARSRLEHRGGGEAHLDRERGRAARTALFRRHGALASPSTVAASCWRPLIYLVMLWPIVRLDQPAGAADRGISGYHRRNRWLEYCASAAPSWARSRRPTADRLVVAAHARSSRAGEGRRLRSRRLSGARAHHVLSALVHDRCRSEIDSWFEREMPNAATRPLVREGRRNTASPSRSAMPSSRPTGIASIRRSWSTAAGKIVGKYRKVHLPGHSEFDPQRAFQHLEKRYFEPGDLGFPVWRIMGGILGMCICNDRRWPETYRVMGLQGVELIVLGYNTPSINAQKSDEGPQKRMFHHRLTLQAGAYQNSTWVVAVAKAGDEDGHPTDRRQRDRQSGRRNRRRGDDRGRRTDRCRLRSRCDDLRQADDIRFRAPPPHRALRPHHQPDGRHHSVVATCNAPSAMVTAAWVGSITGMASASSSPPR